MNPHDDDWLVDVNFSTVPFLVDGLNTGKNSTCPQLEPLSFTNGTSMWPSVLMKVMAILLAAYFFYRIHNKLSVSFGDTRKQYLQPDEKQGDLENERDKTFNCSGAEKISIDCWRDDLLNEKIKNKRGNEDEQKIKNNQKIEDKKPIKFSTLWDEYRCWGKWEFTWKRVSIALLVTSALVIATLFTSLNDVTFHHIRGQSNYEINLWWFGLATLSYVLLILYVAERVHLSSHFIRLLANPKIEIDWPEAVRKTYRNRYGLPEEVVRYRILLDLGVS